MEGNMNSRISRRSLLTSVGSAALLNTSARATGLPYSPDEILVRSGRAIVKPNICLEINGKLAAAPTDETGMRRVKQLGVNHVIMGGPAIPWETDQIRALVDRLKSAGLMLGNMMISGFPNTV
jgi:mannonate dehydratase